MTIATPRVRGSDGRVARDSGEWGREKLEFLEHFGPVAMQATASKHERHYVDLFAGPGLNRLRGTIAGEFDGSPLRALEIVAPSDPGLHFTHAWLVNKDRGDDGALRDRIRDRLRQGRIRVPEGNIHMLRGDSNVLLPDILSQIHPRSYAFVFADPDSPKQLPWSTIAALRDQRKHESVDLYALFPLDMAIRRMLSFSKGTVDQSASVLTAFFGTEEWRDLLQYRSVGSASNQLELGRHAFALYLRQLQARWRYAGLIRDINKGMNHKLYKMVFASEHPAAKAIAAWASKRGDRQGDLWG